MKMLKKIIFASVLLFGCSLVAFGQSNGNPPPKENPPVVPVKPKETPKPTPKPNPGKPNSKTEVRYYGEVIQQVLIG